MNVEAIEIECVDCGAPEHYKFGQCKGCYLRDLLSDEEMYNEPPEREQ